MSQDDSGDLVLESPADPKKDADSSALETRGQVLDLVAGQVTQGRYAPRRRSLAALPGELRGMALAALLPAALAGLGLVHLNTLGPFGAVGGLALWVAAATQRATQRAGPLGGRGLHRLVAGLPGRRAGA
jgi:hypothetical protein